MNELGGKRTLELLLIRTEPPCPRCRKAEAVLRDVASARPGAVALRVIRNDDPEARNYGPLLAPMVLLDAKLVCAGIAPIKAGLQKVVDAELESRGGRA